MWSNLLTVHPIWSLPVVDQTFGDSSNTADRANLGWKAIFHGLTSIPPHLYSHDPGVALIGDTGPVSDFIG
jgi:hypothetical protein